MWKAAQVGPPVLPVSHSHFPLFFSVVAKCEKLLSGRTNNALYWSLLRRDQASMLRPPASKKCCWMTSGRLALIQIDLWAVKDGQINIFCILDRIRVSGPCSHLHIALTYHISIVFVAHSNRSLWGAFSLYILPFFSHYQQWRSCVGLTDLAEIILLALTSSSYSLSARQEQEWLQ